MRDKILRIIDANLNRSTEGLRVAEDIVRFVLDDDKLTSRLKHCRHQVVNLVKGFGVESGERLTGRDVRGDVGSRNTSRSESKRANILDVFMANIKRAQESVRVFEETSKLFDPKLGPKFKKIRFELYDIEQKAALTLKKKIKLDSPIYIITDNSYGYSHLHIMKEAAKAGAKVFQYREKRKAISEKLKEAKMLSKYAKTHRLTFIVNDDPEVALKADADGVHMGIREMGKKEYGLGIKELRKKGKIIGISASNLKEALRAQRLGADYIGFGPVFMTPIKPLVKPTGLKALRMLTGEGLPRRSLGGGGVTKRVTIPVVAIGGVCARTIRQVMSSGAASGAVIRYVSASTNIQKAVKHLLRLSLQPR